jgi:hypothetical protein
MCYGAWRFPPLTSALRMEYDVSQLEVLYRSYLRAANATDDDTRAVILAAAVSEDFLLTSVDYVARGRAEVSAELGARMAAMPVPVTLVPEHIDGHHDVLRAAWTARDVSGTTVASGVHFALGRGDVLYRLYVFVDRRSVDASTDSEAL